jgi:hemoglobin
MLNDIGGEQKMRDLVELFYDLVETLPEGSSLRRLHALKHFCLNLNRGGFP